MAIKNPQNCDHIRRMESLKTKAFFRDMSLPQSKKKNAQSIVEMNVHATQTTYIF